MKWLNEREKLREVITYLIVGALTTFVNLAVYYVCTSTFLNPNNAIELQIANVIAWIIAVIFAYFANRIVVFRSKEANIIKEGVKFCSGRLATLFLEIVLMFAMVSVMHINDKIAKIITQVLVIVGNYIISKLFVFKKK